MQCPKCQRAIDDADGEGAYICCADARLRWRCGQCGKQSEGFAFPYGRCPHCSGKLELCDATRAPQAAPLEGIRTAFEIELGGRAFYQRAAAECSEPALRALFARFAVMEGEHMETLSRRYHLDLPEPTPPLRLEVAALYADTVLQPRDPASLFRIAIALEKRAVRFFSERAATAAVGSPEERLYRELAAEEREHTTLLTTEFARWQHGLPGLFAADPHAAPPRPQPAAGRMLNAAALLLAGHDPLAPALADADGRTLHYAALRDAVARCAAVWRARGVVPGQRVAVQLADGVDWVVGFLGAIWCGAIAVGVNPRIPAPDWGYILDEAGFAAILCDPALNPPDALPAPWRERVLALADWRALCARTEPIAAVPMDEDAPAFWVHSSGTSGKPKAVVHGHRFARGIEQVSRQGLGLHAGDRLFASSKLFFAYPQTNSLFAGLKLGATVLLDAQWPTATSLAASVAALRPTVLFSVPSLYRNLLHEGVAADIVRQGVRLCVAAGEALPASLRAEWQRQTGLTLVSGYGASETLVLVMLDHGDGRDFHPAPGVQVQPLQVLPPGVPSRIRIQAPTLALGYLDRPMAQAEAFREGAFCPADLWLQDAEAGGGWRFAGREDSLVKIHGRWVNLIELEEKLAAQASGIVEAVAVTVPDADGVDAIALFYVAPQPAAVHEALQAAGRTLPPHQRPRWLHAVQSLPRTATGKLLRRKLQELHRSLVT